MRKTPALVTLLLAVAGHSHADELRFSADALERTLKAQLFSAENGRYYLRGNGQTACYISADSPHVYFKDDRVIVHLHTNARLGTQIRGECIGVGLAPSVDVSMIPVTEGETIGFREARIERLSGSRELDFVLKPFLSRQVPSSMKINAATLLRQLLVRSTEVTGYTLTLDRLKIHSMLVQGDALVVDAEGDVSVR